MTDPLEKRSKNPIFVNQYPTYCKGQDDVEQFYGTQINADFPDFFSLFFNQRLSAKISVPFFTSTVQNVLDHDTNILHNSPNFLKPGFSVES